MSKSRSDPAIIHPRIAAQVQIGLMNRRMTIARHGERPYSITPHANKASALGDLLDRQSDGSHKAMTSGRRMAQGINRLRAFAALNPRAPQTANGNTPEAI